MRLFICRTLALYPHASFPLASQVPAQSTNFNWKLAHQLFFYLTLWPDNFCCIYYTLFAFFFLIVCFLTGVRSLSSGVSLEISQKLFPIKVQSSHMIVKMKSHNLRLLLFIFAKHMNMYEGLTIGLCCAYGTCHTHIVAFCCIAAAFYGDFSIYLKVRTAALHKIIFIFNFYNFDSCPHLLLHGMESEFGWKIRNLALRACSCLLESVEHFVR